MKSPTFSAHRYQSKSGHLMIRLVTEGARGSTKSIDAPVKNESDYFDQHFIKHLVQKIDGQFLPRHSKTLEPGETFTLSIVQQPA
jgi:hypothetical protein